MTKRWVKYRHKFASGTGAWEWKFDPDGFTTDNDNDDLGESLRSEHAWSDKYRGVDIELVEQAPSWVVDAEILDATERFRALELRVLALDLDRKLSKACETCGDTKPPELWADRRDFRSCYTCGKEHAITDAAYKAFKEEQLGKAKRKAK